MVIHKKSAQFAIKQNYFANTCKRHLSPTDSTDDNVQAISTQNIQRLINVPTIIKSDGYEIRVSIGDAERLTTSPPSVSWSRRHQRMLRKIIRIMDSKN